MSNSIHKNKLRLTPSRTRGGKATPKKPLAKKGKNFPPTNILGHRQKKEKPETGLSSPNKTILKVQL
jgi:hypothetical protein